MIATLVQFLLPLPWLRGLDGRLRPALDWRDPAVARFFRLMLPVTVALGLINVNTVIGHALRLAADRPRSRAGCDRQGVSPLHAPAGDVLRRRRDRALPGPRHGSRRADELAGFRAARSSSGLRQIGFLLIPAGVVSAVLAEPITRLVYQRGAFTRSRRPSSPGALAAFSIGLVFNGWMLMLNRAYYSLQSNWAPTLVALGNLVLNAALERRLLSRRRLGNPPCDVDLESRGCHSLSCSCCGRGSRVSSADRRRVARDASSPRRRCSRCRRYAVGGARQLLGESFGAQLVAVGAGAHDRRSGVHRRVQGLQGSRDSGGARPVAAVRARLTAVAGGRRTRRKPA